MTLIQTDFIDTETGEPLYEEYKRRSALVRFIRCLRLFCAIVWRTWEPGYRIGIATAWSVARGIWK